MIEAAGKTTQSIPYFRGTRVSTCADIVRRNGRMLAVPFSVKKKTLDLDSEKKLHERRSITHEAFQLRQNLHLGMSKKPLEPYHPDAHRSRMKTEEFIMPYKNSSSIVLGDRSYNPTSHFKTTTQSFSLRPRTVYTTNEGILSQLSKWQHTHEWQ